MNNLMKDDKVATLLEWFNYTEDPDLKSSNNSYIAPSIQVVNSENYGRGIYANQRINAKQLLIKIPPSYLLNFTTIIPHITAYSSTKLADPIYANIYVPPLNEDRFSSIYAKLTVSELLNLSSFQIVSLYLTFECQRKNSFWKPFIDTLPDISDFTLNPLIWKVLQVSNYDQLYKALPKSTKDHADKVHHRFITDYDVIFQLISQKIPNPQEYLSKQRFLWAWMCINSRCLYMNMPQAKNNTDNFTMAPYVDFLNHSTNDQCELKIDRTGFHVYTTTSYDTNEQIFLSYGPHSNEFLLCEYGFMIPSGNNWNDLDLSDIIIKLLNQDQVEFLKEYEYFGEYTINIQSGLSFRTEVVLATLQEQDPKESRKLLSLINGFIDVSNYKKNSNTLLKELLLKTLHDSNVFLNLKLEYSDKATNDRFNTIRDLYKIRHDIAQKYIDSL